MRVIAGKFRSRPLRSVRGLDLRPTSDRLRETLFNVLSGGDPAALNGSVWLDLFAGTGAVGIEALSRGAARVEFVESSPRAAKLIEQNLASLGIHDGFHIVRADILAGLRRLQTANGPADFVFFDPPYRLQSGYQQTLEFLAGSSLLRSASVVIAEHDRKSDPGEAFSVLHRFRKLEQGDAALSFYRLQR